MDLSIPELLAEAVGEGGLPARPDAALDPYLDAAETCVRRYGWSRTSPRDIARAAGVERTTIYRHLGPKDRIFRLLIAREVHRLIDHAIEVGATHDMGPFVVVELLASTVEQLSNNPVITKLVDDDPELIVGLLQKGLPDVIERLTTTLRPALAAAMEADLLTSRDPAIVIEWLVRVGLSLLLTPPPGDLRVFLREVLDPVLGE